MPPIRATQLTKPRVHRFTRDEYHRMAAGGLFDGRDVQLVEGEVIEMPPQNDPHALTVVFVDYTLRQVFGAGYTIRVQLPFRVGLTSEPEPDVAVVAGPPRAQTGHPSTALLLVEVADTTLALDRGRKARAYARAGVEDYWIVNLIDRCVEVHRQPVAVAAGRGRRFRYSDVSVVPEPGAVSPLAAPGATLLVKDLLP